MPKGWMYILECGNGAYYTGSTNNLDLRMQQHQAGEGANFTKKHLPVKLVYYEQFERIDQAFYREKQVQGWSRKKKQALISGEYNKLPELSRNYTQRGVSTSSTPGNDNAQEHGVSTSSTPVTATDNPVAELVEATPNAVEATPAKAEVQHGVSTSSTPVTATDNPVAELVEATPNTVEATPAKAEVQHGVSTSSTPGTATHYPVEMQV